MALQNTDQQTDLKARLADSIDRARDDLVAFGEDIFAHPELGFREQRTAAAVADALRKLDLQPREGLAMTGVKACLKGSRPGPTICIMGELDALPVADHVRADPATGAAHACGHNCQVTHVVGAARALVETDALKELAGDVVFIAVPAEEYVDLEWRAEQARAGKLELLAGKAEFIRLGELDDVDIVMLVHAVARPGTKRSGMGWRYNGLVAKRVRFIGRASHAGASPHLGINALNAASLAIQAIHVQRETFRDEDHIRVHPIMTHGGTTINVVPADVRLETFVRGATAEAIADAEAKVDRALKAGAMAVGATVEIETLPGYLPLAGNRDLAAIYRRNAHALLGEDEWSEVDLVAASTDAGDVNHLLPVVHPSHGGCIGSNHGADFAVSDPDTAYITPAKLLAWTVVDLLSDDAAQARQALANYKPLMTKQSYLEHARRLTRTERTVY